MLGEFPVARHQLEILCGIYSDEKAIKRIARDELLADISKYMRFFNFQNLEIQCAKKHAELLRADRQLQFAESAFDCDLPKGATLTNLSAESS